MLFVFPESVAIDNFSEKNNEVVQKKRSGNDENDTMNKKTRSKPLFSVKIIATSLLSQAPAQLASSVLLLNHSARNGFVLALPDFLE